MNRHTLGNFPVLLPLRSIHLVGDVLELMSDEQWQPRQRSLYRLPHGGCVCVVVLENAMPQKQKRPAQGNLPCRGKRPSCPR